MMHTANYDGNFYVLITLEQLKYCCVILRYINVNNSSNKNNSSFW